MTTDSDGADKIEVETMTKKAVQKAANRAVRSLGRRVGLVLGLVAALMTIFGLKGIDIFIKNQVDSIKKSVEKVLGHAQSDAAAVRDEIDDAREEINTMFAEIKLAPYRYEMEIPIGQGSFEWRTNIEISEYSVAIIAGSYIYGFECDYRTVVKEIYMDRSDERWSLLVNKTSGCDRLLVDVVYVPSTWTDEVRSGELERMLDRY